MGTDTEFALSKSLHVIVNITKLMNSLDVHSQVNTDTESLGSSVLIPHFSLTTADPTHISKHKFPCPNSHSIAPNRFCPKWKDKRILVQCNPSCHASMQGISGRPSAKNSRLESQTSQ